MDDLHILSLNVRGLRNGAKRKNLFRYFRKEKFSVVCIQESYITDNDYELWKKEWGGELIYFKGTRHAKGQLILLQRNFPYKWSVEVLSERIVAISFSVNDKDITVFNVYAPNVQTDTKEFFSQLNDLVSACTSPLKVICGDFNAVLDNQLDVISGEKHSTTLVNLFNAFIDGCDLTDVWRSLNPDVKEYTWSRKSCNKFTARRLDYVLLSNEAMDAAIESTISSVASSDHRGVHVILKGLQADRGPGYYKFNNALLKDHVYVEKMNQIIDTALLENIRLEPQQKWELLKLEIRDKTIQYSKNRSVWLKNHYVDCQNKLNKCESELAKFPDNPTLQQKCLDLKLQLECQELERLKSAQTRARMRWVDEGERNTKFFLNLEKSKASAKLFPNIELEDGNKITDQFEILNVQKDYYQSLYSKESNLEQDQIDEKMNKFIENCTIPTLSEDEMNQCEGKITVDEAARALQTMKNDSSPGLDGLTTGFIKMFWAKLKNVIVDSFNSSFDKGALSYTQACAVLTLLHKGKNLPKNKLANWRPISITNTDYKILAKCLANRLSPVINKIIQDDQVGYIKGRNVSTTLRTIDDVIEYCRINNKPGILLALDFKKAFDSVSKKYMLSSFKKFGFGKEFLQWVSVLFSETRSCIIYNGWLSEEFEMNCGIRQGCPFSPLAFIISLELLAIRLRHSKDIKGITLFDSDIFKILLYADDISMFLTDESDAKAVFNVIKEFSNFSSLYLNMEKSEVMGIGAYRNRVFNLGVKQVNNIKILGIYFDSNKCASEVEMNWTERISKMKANITNWEKRNIGVLGKICIIKSFLISQFVYVMQAFRLPEKVLKDINTILYRFLWRKKDCNKKAYEKVKRVVINSEFEKGGIGMIDIKIMQDSFLCQWFSRLLDNNQVSKWSCIPKKIFSIFGKNLAAFKASVKPSSFKGLDQVNSVFWYAVARTWLTYNTKVMEKQGGNACLWNNPLITYQNSVVYFKRWAQCGVTYVKDLIRNNLIISYDYLQTVIPFSPNLYLEYIVVYSAVSTFLRSEHYIPQENIQPELCCRPFFNGMEVKTAKQFRNYIVNLKYSPPCSAKFWQGKFDIVLDKTFWNIAIKSTTESRLRELHWKVLHNIFPTNILLQKMGITNSNKCSSCITEIDYVEHFFFHCKKIKVLWKYVQDILLHRYDISIVLKVEHVLFGVKPEMVSLDDKKLKCLNNLILIGKMCVSKFRYGTPIHITLIFERELLLRKPFRKV